MKGLPSIVTSIFFSVSLGVRTTPFWAMAKLESAKAPTKKGNFIEFIVEFSSKGVEIPFLPRTFFKFVAWQKNENFM